jgi:hypothetical protein
MRSALRGHTIQGNLVLSTSEGKYVVSKNIKRWRPVSEYFSNHSTILLQTIRAQHKDVAIGGRVPYVVDLKFLDGSEAVIPMRRDDFQLVRFREWQLTKDALETAQTLRTFLGKQKDAGILRCERFEVYDIESWRAKSRSFYDEHPYEAQSVGFFRHLFIGRYRTWKDHRWIREENRRLNAQPTDNVQEIASVTFSDKPEHNDPPSGG